MTDPTPLTSPCHDARPPARSALSSHRSDRPSNLRRQEPGPAAADLAALRDRLRGAPEGMASQVDELAATFDALEHARRRYHDLFELAPDAYIVSDADGRVLEANAAAIRLIGRTRAATYGRSLLSFLASDSARAVAAAIRALEAAAPGDLLEWDMRIRGRGRGPSRSVRARVRLVAHRPGSPAQLLWLLRHSPDEERHRPHPFASDRSSRGEPADRSLYALLDAVPDALLLLDAERRVLFGNRAAARLVGPATGRPLDDLLLAAVHPDDRARVRRSLLHGNRPAGHDGATRFRLCRDDGSWRDVAATIVRAPPGSGAHGALLSMRDVSDFTRAEQTAEAFRAYQAVAAALTAEAAGPADDRAIAERVARLAVPAIADSCVIYLLDADGTARPVAAHHHERRDSPAGARLPPVGVDAAPRAGLIARVIGDREPLLVPALTQHGSAQLAGDIALESGEPAIRPSSLLVLPLTADGSRATGALLLSYTRSGRRYGDEDLLLGRDLARQLALVLECARLARQVRRSGGDGSPVGGDAGSEAAQRWEPGGEDTGRQVSRREREVLDLLEQGLTNRQIAARLVLSERTVEHHISRMLARFRLATRTHLTAYALKQGLIGGRRPTSG